MGSDSKRRLIWVPVIHAEADLGEMSQSVQRLYVRRMGRAKWKEHVDAVQRLWRETEDRIEGIGLAYERVRLYQDGLPDCGRESEIVAALAKAGSPNHRLLLKLIARGAQITGTESPELLLEEYAFARRVFGSGGGPEANLAHASRRSAGDRRILKMRDRYIGRRIGETLQEGETGLIFLGLLHSLDGELPADIRVTRLPMGTTPDRGRRSKL